MPGGVSFDQPLRDARDAFERSYLEYQLEKHGGNVSQMAKSVGMERTHLYRKLRSLGIDLNFAPCVDLALDPRNPVIAACDRSGNVSEFSEEVVLDYRVEIRRAAP